MHGMPAPLLLTIAMYCFLTGSICSIELILVSKMQLYLMIQESYSCKTKKLFKFFTPNSDYKDQSLLFICIKLQLNLCVR